MPSTASIPLSCALALFIADVCAAQSAYAPRYPGAPPMLQRLDQAHSDLSPLSDSLREVNMATDLRAPMGFQYVYRVPGRDDLIMRANGGVYAIYPQSEYVVTERGLTPVIPAGTVFSIGVPNAKWMPVMGRAGPTLQNLHVVASSVTPPVASEQHDLIMREVSDRALTRRGSEAFPDEWNADGAPDMNPQDALRGQRQYQVVRATPPEPSTFLKTVADDALRNERIAELLQQALQASRQGGG